MSAPEFLSPSEAARRLGVSAKALRLYEERGLVTPTRSAAGWRAYGPNEMNCAADIAALRALGFSLNQVARVLAGDSRGLAAALAAHQTALEAQARAVSQNMDAIRAARDGLARGQAPSLGTLTQLAPARAVVAAFDLPWPWGGEQFELRDMRALNYIVGPLGSGKTRLAMKIAETVPNARFLGLERSAQDPCGAAQRARVEQVVAWLIEDGATPCDALTALLIGVEAGDADVIVIDMIEQGLDDATQEALIAYLRRRGADARPLFAMTRSCSILDLAAVGPHETILYCPANHSLPMLVSPYPGAPGYEAVATCLAPPDVRARTEGVIAYRPPSAA